MIDIITLMHQNISKLFVQRFDSNNDEDIKESDTIDFDLIYKNLESQQIKGKYLLVFDKNDLRNLGFNLFKQQCILTNQIKKLGEKYPIPQDNEDDITNNQIEGLNNDQITTRDGKYNSDINKYDLKYICPITNKLFKSPVIAYDGNVYEKEEIIKYIRKNKCTPLDINNKLKDNNEVESMINMLFPDNTIKNEIKQMLKKE